MNDYQELYVAGVIAQQQRYQAQEWLDLAKKFLELTQVQPRSIADPDGPPVPLPQKPAFIRTITTPTHDFISALRRPYEPIA